MSRSVAQRPRKRVPPQPVKDVFKEKFGPIQYIETYYPPITDSKFLFEIATDIERQLHTVKRVTISNIVANFGVSCELVENVVVFDFQAFITKLLLKEFIGRRITVLDIGGGPTIYQHIGLSLVAQHITHSEYLEHNRRVVLSWLRKEEEAHDWDGYFALMQGMLNRDADFIKWLKKARVSTDRKVAAHAREVYSILTSGDVQPFKHRVRTVIGEDVVHGDVFHPRLGLTRTVQKTFDIVTANFVVEGATADWQEWRRGMEHLMGHVESGGYLIMTAIKNAEWYPVGNERLPAVKVDEEHLKQLCAEKNFSLVNMHILDGSDKESVGYDGMVLLIARNEN